MARPTKWDDVLDVAARLFAEKGFAATSVREVAEGAALTKAGLYYHIREKEDLLFRICEHTISTILQEAEPAIAASTSAPDRIRAVIAVHLGFFHRHPDNVVVLKGETGQLSAPRRKAIVVLERQYLDLIRKVILDGQRAGTFGNGDATVLAFSLLSMLNGLDAWYDPAGRIAPAELTRQIGDLFLRGVAVDGLTKRQAAE